MSLMQETPRISVFVTSLIRLQDQIFTTSYVQSMMDAALKDKGNAKKSAMGKLAKKPKSPRTATDTSETAQSKPLPTPTSNAAAVATQPEPRGLPHYSSAILPTSVSTPVTPALDHAASDTQVERNYHRAKPLPPIPNVPPAAPLRPPRPPRTTTAPIV
jgi:hypothetical protein